MLKQICANMETYAIQMNAFKEEPIKGCRASIMGIEGNMAKIYWRAIAECLPAPYAFSKRSRRPAEDLFNASLNYLYGMLYNTVHSACLAAGLESSVGILHQDSVNKPTLVFDMIEPFRPWADQLLIELCLSQKISEGSLEEVKGGVRLNRSGRKVIIKNL